MGFVLGLVGLFVLPGSALAMWQGAILLSDDHRIWLPIVIGFIVGFFVYKLLISNLHWLTTFEHELTHAIVAFFFFRRIKRFVVTGNRGGYMSFSEGTGGDIGDHLIGLAPYYFPTLTLGLVSARGFIPPQFIIWYDAFIGFTLAYHTFSTIKELRGNWDKNYFKSVSGRWNLSDIGQSGYIVSGLVIISLTLVIHSVLCYMVPQGPTGLIGCLKLILGTSSSIYTQLIIFIANFSQG